MRYIVTIAYEGHRRLSDRPLPAADLKKHIEDRYLYPITVEPIDPGSDLALAIEREVFSR